MGSDEPVGLSSPPQPVPGSLLGSPNPLDASQGPEGQGQGSPSGPTTANVMRYEERRLSTFQDWPANAKVDARKIAKAGFHHTGSETRVQCSWCGCVLSDWNYGDQVGGQRSLISLLRWQSSPHALSGVLSASGSFNSELRE